MNTAEITLIIIISFVTLASIVGSALFLIKALISNDRKHFLIFLSLVALAVASIILEWYLFLT